MCSETCDFNTLEDTAWRVFLSACCCKNESDIGFLTVTSSWGYQHGFSAETSQFLSNTTHFCDWVFFKLFAKLSGQWNIISFCFTLTWASSSRFDMENMEILGFQFEPYQGTSTWFKFGWKLGNFFIRRYWTNKHF